MAKAEKKEPAELPPLFIRERMKGLGMTGESVGEKMGTTAATVSRLLTGDRKMTLEWLYAFSKALNVPIVDLFSAPGDQSPSARSPETQLRTAMLAFGVDGDDLGRAVSAVKVFVDDLDEQPSQDLPRDQSEPSNRRRAKEPSK